jgi:hypothetical protein
MIEFLMPTDTKIFRERWPSRLVVTATATREMKAPQIDPGLRELVGLSLLSGGGCSLALGKVTSCSSLSLERPV